MKPNRRIRTLALAAIAVLITVVVLCYVHFHDSPNASTGSADPVMLPQSVVTEETTAETTPETTSPAASISPATSAPPALSIPSSPIEQSPVEETETGSSPSPSPTPSDIDFVKITDYIPTIRVELKYATTDNFTGTVIYGFTDAYLRYATVKKLAEVQSALNELGYGLKIWDAYRPVSAQWRLWEVFPDPVFVANPTTGFSSHSKGCAVDVTLVDLDGNELVMPSYFDDFSALADRNYDDVSAEAASNAALLESVMTEHGFEGYLMEWWHYSDTSDYPVEEAFNPV